jgi:2-hydroxychromene-2-carboxylate isomerase
MTHTFAVTWDYRCPFARNAHEHLLTGLAGGADWQVRFLPFSLAQAHVGEGEPSVWDKPEQYSGILALQIGVVVRDEFAEQFPAVHRALFSARHDESLDLDDPKVVCAVLSDHDVPADAVFARIDSGEVLRRVQAEHEQYVQSHQVWGVPTFIAENQAAFVRFTHRAAIDADPEISIQTIERTVDLLSGWPELNEFKHTSIPR